VILLFLVPLQSRAISSDNLKAYWACEETSGVRYDSHGSNDLTDNNTVLYATGIVGNACDFEASNSEYLSRTTSLNDDLEFAGDYSASFWLKFETLGNYGIYHRRYDKSYMFSYINSVTYWRYFNSNDGVGWSSPATVSDSLSAGTWYHIVVTYDASAGKVEVFRNGTSQGSSSSADTSQDTGGTEFKLGDNEEANNYDGLIDEIAFFDTILTQSDIDDLYGSGSPDDYDTLFGTTTASSTQSSSFITIAGNSIYEINSISCVDNTPTTTCSYNYATDTYSVHYLSAEAQQLSTLALLLIMATLVSSITAIGVIWTIRA
jgi:hypothetical protein